MRRLTEILALPKAWYRRTLARRLFLGEETSHDILDEEGTFLIYCHMPEEQGLHKAALSPSHDETRPVYPLVRTQVD